MIIKGSASSEDMYVSIDKAVFKIKEQLLKYKRRLQEHHAKGVPSIDMTVNVFRSPELDEILDVNEEIEEENFREIERKYRPHQIVKTEKCPLSILTNEEAIMKMELSGDPFLVFINEEDRKVKVIYQREDGHFGIMEPEATY
jgi:putative sigma-54 modulation protein